MNATRNKSSRPLDDESPPSPPQITPPSIGPGHPNFFPMQAVLDISTSLGEIKANIAHLTKSVDSMKTKVDDLVRWKTLILGGVVVISVVITSTAFLISKFSSYITIKAPDTPTQHAEPATPPVVAPPSK